MTKPWFEEAAELLAAPMDEECYIGNDFVEGCATCAGYARGPTLLKAALEERNKLLREHEAVMQCATEVICGKANSLLVRHGATGEREAIVAWLRGDGAFEGYPARLASLIESGQHLKR